MRSRTSLFYQAKKHSFLACHSSFRRNDKENYCGIFFVKKPIPKTTVTPPLIQK